MEKKTKSIPKKGHKAWRRLLLSMPMLPLFDVQYKEREGEATRHQAAPDQPLTQEANLVIVPRPAQARHQRKSQSKLSKV